MQEVVQLHDTWFHRFQLVLFSRRELHKSVFLLLLWNLKAIAYLFCVRIEGTEFVKVGFGLIHTGISKLVKHLSIVKILLSDDAF